MATIPNYRQSERMASDLSLLASHQYPQIKDWTGSSYTGRAISTWPARQHAYELTHWDTLIARFVETPTGIALDYFDATYHSVSTRAFQGRILAAVADYPNIENTIRDELAKPTQHRGIIRGQE